MGNEGTWLEAWGPSALRCGGPPDIAGEVLETDGQSATVQEPGRDTTTPVNLHGGWPVCRIITKSHEI